jgi:hypothetical protein
MKAFINKFLSFLIVALIIIAISITGSWSNTVKIGYENSKKEICENKRNINPVLHKNTSYSTSEAPNDFTTQGLNYEVEFLDIYMGNFEDIPFRRDEMIFGLMFNIYVSTYAKYCPNNLPEDKVELARQACDQYRVTKNGYGIEISRTCISYRTERTGLFAAPEMYAAMQVLNDFQIGNMLSMIGGSDGGFGNAIRTSGEMKSIYSDMANLLRMNSCDSPGLRRFQENFRLFALNRDPIRMEALIAEKKANKVMLSKKQNMQQLVDDLIYQSSRQWNFNRYHKGSAFEVSITSTDSQGRPSKVTASYTFTGFTGTKKGSVKVVFDREGMPDCLYFFDFPNTCRPASKKIVNDYARNTYASEDVNEPLSPPNNFQNETIDKRPSTDRRTTDIPFAVIENVPTYPGCEDIGTNQARKKCTSEKISQFVNENFNTQLASKLGLSGINRIIVQFRINHNGIIEDIRARAPHPELELEALRVLKLMPKMTPGSQQGKLVGVMYSLPIAFKVNGTDEISKNKKINPSQNKEVEKSKTNNPSNKKLRKLLKLKKEGDNN